MTTEDFTKLYQAQALASIKGAFFRFHRRSNSKVESSNIYGSKVCIKDERKRIEQFEAAPDEPFLIAIHPTFGRPGAMAYRIWIELEKILSKRQDSLTISASDLLALIGVKKNKNRLLELNIALHQLQHTEIFYHSEPFVHTKTNKRASFGLISRETNFSPTKVAYQVYDITIHPFIIDLMRNKRKFFSFNYDRLANLTPSSQCFALLVLDGMTRRYIKYQKVGESGSFYYKKSYPAICDQWLAGSTPYSYRSDANKNHLAQRLSDLVECGILSKETVLTPEMVVHFYPGTGFLDDYHTMYASKKSTVSEFSDVAELIRYFGKCYTGAEHRQAPVQDYPFADELIQHFKSIHKAKQFVFYAVQCASQSKWSDIRYMKAISRYIEPYERTLITPTSTTERVDDDQYRPDYEAAMKSYVLDIYETLATKDKEKVDEAVAASKTPNMSRDELIVQFMDIYRHVTLPSYSTWLAQQAIVS